MWKQASPDAANLANVLHARGQVWPGTDSKVYYLDRSVQARTAANHAHSLQVDSADMTVNQGHYSVLSFAAPKNDLLRQCAVVVRDGVSDGGTHYGLVAQHILCCWSENNP
jgi:hypothetical protein